MHYRPMVRVSFIFELYAFIILTSTPVLGTYLIVGAWGGDGADYLKIFKKNGNNYGQIGSNVIGEGGQFAYAVDMSSDGSKFVVGANLPNDNEGKAYLYVSPPTGNGNGGKHH